MYEFRRYYMLKINLDMNAIYIAGVECCVTFIFTIKYLVTCKIGYKVVS